MKINIGDFVRHKTKGDIYKVKKKHYHNLVCEYLNSNSECIVGRNEVDKIPECDLPPDSLLYNINKFIDPLLLYSRHDAYLLIDKIYNNIV